MRSRGLILLVAVPIATAPAPAAVARTGRPVRRAPDMAELDRNQPVTVGAAPVRASARDGAGPVKPRRRLVGAEQQ